MRERGNILFLILLAVILFAALSYAVTQSLRGGGQDASPEKMKAAAAEMVQYLTGVRNAIGRMKLVNGCTDTQISFDYNNGATECLTSESPATNYENPNSPTNCKCHVFHPLGGGMPFNPATNSAFNRYFVDGTYYRFSGESAVPHLNTPLPELYVYLNDSTPASNATTQAFCGAFNEVVGAADVDHITPTTSISAAPFIGTYGAHTGSNFRGKPAACFTHVGGKVIFYFTLIER